MPEHCHAKLQLGLELQHSNTQRPRNMSDSPASADVVEKVEQDTAVPDETSVKSEDVSEKDDEKSESKESAQLAVF